MALASLREDIWERFVSATEAVPEPDRTIWYQCHICDQRLASEAERLEHLAADHRADAPALFLYGRIASDEERLREVLAPAQVSVANCTAAYVAVNGGIPQLTDLADIGKVITARRNDLIDLTLINAFDSRAHSIERRWRVWIEVARAADLQRVDDSFRRTLAKEQVGWDELARFRDGQTHDGTRSYGLALADYVQGVLIRDRAPGTVVPLDQHQECFNHALEELKWYRRPLAELACSIIRFAQNDFSRAERASGWQLLDQANETLAAMAGRVGASASSRPVLPGGSVMVCPVDAGVDAVLAFAAEGAAKRRWSQTASQIAEERASTASLDARDRCKMFALWAFHAIRLKAPGVAVRPLRQLDGDPTFGAWAARKLEEARG